MTETLLVELEIQDHPVLFLRELQCQLIMVLEVILNKNKLFVDTILDGLPQYYCEYLTSKNVDGRIRPVFMCSS